MNRLRFCAPQALPGIRAGLGHPAGAATAAQAGQDKRKETGTKPPQFTNQKKFNLNTIMPKQGYFYSY
ncbi:hypothetical protein EBQ24_00090 [Allofranklinella schreckenbergeri]|uniref:Uncharacterized protein n=1 Tax=Allofranklinella schreckenbergeri TaxID=1076744 RepID=A0A3M6R8K9_9BURK|nr:hypothetical protein EBQ24_00090 [Allofranklinella schreckenbergeri]